MAALSLKSEHMKFMRSVSFVMRKVIRVGSFVTQKKRPVSSAKAQIQAKPVVYQADGSGRDSYIASNCGGFRPLHKAGLGHGTYYDQLRRYPESTHIGRKSSQPVKPS